MTAAIDTVSVYSHGRPTVLGTRGMVASAHPLATLAGVQMLQQGGNAFDAIASTAAALNVVEPYMSGLSGQGLAMVYTAKDDRTRALDFHPPLPKAFDATKVAKPETTTGPNASGVPGSLAAWCKLVDELGNLDLPAIFAPAISYAEEGFATTNFFQAMTESGLSRDMQPEWRQLYYDGSEGAAIGKVFCQPELARTLTAIAGEGPGYLYGGPLGQKMAAHIQSLGGCMDESDLASVEPEWQDPVSTTYAGMDVHVPPSPATSFQVLLSLAMLEKTGLGGMDHLSADHLDRVFRTIRLSAECRIENTKATHDEIAELVGETHIAEMCERLTSPAATYGRTEDYGDGPLPQDKALKEHTTSFSAVDREGNAVCITQSLGSMYGSGVVIPGTGVCMNNFLNWGDLHPDSHNFLKGGERFAMCLAPTISLKDGAFELALGTPGSFGILQTQVQAFVHHLHYGLDLQAAIDAPRGRLWDGSRIELENRIEAPVVAELRARGHDIQSIAPFSMLCGGMQAIRRDPLTGVLSGAADSRRDGAAIAV